MLRDKVLEVGRYVMFLFIVTGYSLDRVLLLAAEFCSVAGHLRTPADIWAILPPSPNVRQD